MQLLKTQAFILFVLKSIVVLDSFRKWAEHVRVERFIITIVVIYRCFEIFSDNEMKATRKVSLYKIANNMTWYF